MARRRLMGASAMLAFVVVVVQAVLVSSNSELIVTLEMPRFATIGSTVILECNYNVKPEQVYKVEWHKEYVKIAQYINGRKPPFKISRLIPEAIIDKSLATERSIMIQDVGFKASGRYYCDVTLENPIFTLVSEGKDLLVIQPQMENPSITFSARTYTSTDTLEASCTTSPAYPRPHIIWLVNDEKVDESMTIPMSQMYHRRAQEARNTNLLSATTKLRLPVSFLRLNSETQINLTCLATIPAYCGFGERCGDTANVTAIVHVGFATEPEPSTTTEIIVEDDSSSSRCSIEFLCFAIGLMVNVFRNA